MAEVAWREFTSRPSLAPEGKRRWTEPSQQVGFLTLVVPLVFTVICGLIGAWVPAGIGLACTLAALIWISF